MWSPLLLCLLVGFVSSSTSPAWKDNKEYVYEISGRTLTSLDIGNEYSGVLVKLILRIQTRPDGKLQCLINKPKYAQIHSELSDGAMTYIPSAEVNWKVLEWTNQPFQIVMKRGTITDLIVNKDLPNWQANIIKGIVSQFQMNLNQDHSYFDNRHDSAAYKMYEETVSGNIETQYNINPMPDHLLVNSPTIPNFQVMEEDENDVLEVIKFKNYTNNLELPSYVYGLGNIQDSKVATNVMGNFFVRSTLTTAYVTGSVKKFTIQNCVTVNKISVKPTISDRQRGSVISVWNATLEKVKSQDQILEDVPEPVHLGSLVYTYGKPYASSNEVSNETEYKQKQPQINQAAETPLLAYTVGNKGRSVKLDTDIVSSVVDIAKEIGRDLQDPKNTLEENTLEKFTILIKLIRVMDEQELRKAGNELNPNNRDSSLNTAWAIYRDAVAESGSQPALLVIQSWIEVKTIKSQEASHVISSMANAIQEPSNEYMRVYFELIKKEVVKAQWPLNETAILTFAELTHQVYFNDAYYKTHFPRESFKNLREKQGVGFVKKTVIPYFTECLNKAISKDKPNKIHTYIRALGYIGTPEILAAFEPYLEGTKHCSQFQRTLMVISMDKLVKTHPEIMRHILFKIYSNSGEHQATRVAAIYQLMRSNPNIEMLQRMAAYTKVDQQEQVNAAVKTSIKNAAKLNTNEFIKLSYAAKMAEPLLTKREYGLHQGGNYLRNYFIEELHYKETARLFGSSDAFYPKGIKYALRSDEGGIKNQIVNIQALLTSVEQLSNVVNQQTKKYKEEKEQQRNKQEGQQRNPFSSQQVAKLLNMKAEAIEQLEGSLFIMDWVMPLKMLSIDNSTIEQLPKAFEQWEKQLNNYNQINYVKLTNSDDVILAFPTEMGIPFVFSYDDPKFIKVDGKVRLIANPKISQNGKFQKPKSIKIMSDMRLTFGKKIQGHISFITPFDHQQYYSGFDKVMQIHVPLILTSEVNFNENEITMEVNPEVMSSAPFFHYSSWPYTSRKNIMDFRNLMAQNHNQYIMPRNIRTLDTVVGKEKTGLAYRIKMEHSRKSMKMSDLNVFYQKGFVDGLRYLWSDADIHYSQLNVSYIPQMSSTKKIQLRLGYEQNYREQSERDSTTWEQISTAKEPSQRRKMLLKMASSNINNVQSHAVDVSVRFQGDKTIDYVLSGAYARSYVDPKSGVYAFYKQDTQSDEPYEVTFKAVNEVLNTNVLNLEDALSDDAKINSVMELQIDHLNNQPMEITADVKITRSDKRTEYLKSNPIYSQCKRDMRKTNYQSPACINMTTRAPFMDQVDMLIKYKNIDPIVQDLVETSYDYYKYTSYPNLEVDVKTYKANQIQVQARVDPDFRYLNVSVQTPEQKNDFRDIELNDYTRVLVAFHPTHHVFSRLLSKVLEIDTVYSVCVVDQTQFTTFSNRTYETPLSNYWTVLTQFVPKMAIEEHQVFLVEKQLQLQRSNIVVLARKSEVSQNSKDVKIVLSAPETDFDIIEITMTPEPSASGAKGSVTVNKKRIEIENTRGVDIKDGHVKIYSLPNGEINVIVENSFELIYDGQRIRLEGTSSMLRDSTRGICGQWNDQQNEDTLSPQNCLARDPEKFVKSYQVEGPEGQKVRQEFSKNSNQCVEIVVPLYVDVISKADKQKTNNYYESSIDECSNLQTRYVERENEICFTTRVVQVCSKHCRAQGYITKNVSVHCIPKSNVALLWKQQIDNGGNPDFSHKQEHMKLQLEIPQSCSN